MQKISVVIPVYNEEANIHEVYGRLNDAFNTNFKNFEREFVFVDDGSSDKSFDLLADLCKKDSFIKVIQFSRNFGHHVAISAGLDYVKGDFIVMMDGDLQDRPEDIIKLYHKLKEGYDVVYGKYVHKKFSLIRRFFSRCFLYFIKFLLSENITINTSIFRIMTKQVVEPVRNLREQNRYIIGIIGWVGFKHASILIRREKRKRGTSKYTFRKQMDLAINAISSFSVYPLEIMSRVGFLLMFFSFILALYIVLRRFVYGVSVMGWASIITLILLIGGIQIFFLGVLGSYLGKAYLEVKKRPLYVVRKIIGYPDEV